MNISHKKFQQRLLNWFDQYGRKDLPWQKNKTPYSVWLSEIMLQQTQVATVIDYYQRFLTRFPNIQALAVAKLDDVLHLWAGLGYYSRARNLHRTAQILHETTQQLPSSLDDLIKLPGIGESTAGAILALAWNKQATILDGNVKRVLTRLYGINEWPGDKATLTHLWQIASQLTPKERIADYTQAMMDMGATLCTRSRPQCSKCPFNNDCLARLQGIENNIPVAKPRKKIPIREATFFILKYRHFILLERRPNLGIWSGLWSFPEVSGSLAMDEIEKLCQNQFHIKPLKIQSGQAFRHTFSHFHLDIKPVYLHLRLKPRKIMDSEEQIWYNLQQSQAVGLPAPIKKILKDML